MDEFIRLEHVTFFYEDEAEARQCFKDECDGVIYHTEAY